MDPTWWCLFQKRICEKVANLFWVVTIGKILLSPLSPQIEYKRNYASVQYNKTCWFWSFRITLTCSVLFLELFTAVARATKALQSILGCCYKDNSIRCGSSEIRVVLLLYKQRYFQYTTCDRTFFWSDIHAGFKWVRKESRASYPKSRGIIKLYKKRFTQWKWKWPHDL